MFIRDFVCHILKYDKEHGGQKILTAIIPSREALASYERPVKSIEQQETYPTGSREVKLGGNRYASFQLPSLAKVDKAVERILTKGL